MELTKEEVELLTLCLTFCTENWEEGERLTIPEMLTISTEGNSDTLEEMGYDEETVSNLLLKFE